MKKVKYNELRNSEANIIDLRSSNEFKTSHIPGSKNIPYDDLIANYRKYLNKNDTYYLICKEGHLSKRAVSILDFLGYSVVLLEK